MKKRNSEEQIIKFLREADMGIPVKDLRESILALAHRYRRYGAGMIYLNLRQRGGGGQPQAC